ncbi:hypothetical protein INQ48_16610 [Variovorax paradoxus]|nr:hypothetical protein INQ48_16610 [Variovorax paradoxus]
MNWVREISNTPASSSATQTSSTTARRCQLGGPCGAVALTAWRARPAPPPAGGGRGTVGHDVHHRAVAADELHLEPEHVARAPADAHAAHLGREPAVDRRQVERPLAGRTGHGAAEIALQRAAVAAERAAHGFDQAQQFGHAVERQRAVAAAARQGQRVALDRHGLDARRQGAAHQLVGRVEAQGAARIERAFEAVHEALLGEAGLAALLLGQQAHQFVEVEGPGRCGAEGQHQQQRLEEPFKPPRAHLHLRARNHGN